MTTAVFVWTVDDLVGVAALLVIVAFIALAFAVDRLKTASGALVRLRAKRPARRPMDPLVSFPPDRVRVIGCQREVSEFDIISYRRAPSLLYHERYRLMDDILNAARGCIEITRVDKPGKVTFSGKLVVIVPPGAATAPPPDPDEHGPALAGGKCS